MGVPAILPAPDATTKRISMRRRRDTGALSDVVGHLIAANAEWMVVLPEDREAVWVPRSEVETIRTVPERTVLPASAPDAVQRILDLAWPGLRRGRLGGWTVRVGRGATRRANSVLAVGDPGRALDEARAVVAGWAGEELPLQAVLGGRTADEALALGWAVDAPTVVMVAALGDLAREDAPAEVVAAETPDAAWLAVFRGGGVDDARLAELTAAPARYLRLGAHAVGRMAQVRDWAVLSCVEVAPQERGRGLGRAVTRALVAEAARLGARHVAVQVEEDNPAARELYAAEGFVEHHTYGYLAPGR